MTHNQIEYQKLLEQKRANRAIEALTSFRDVETINLRSQELSETERHNKRVEDQADIDLGVKQMNAASTRMTAESQTVANIAAAERSRAEAAQTRLETSWYTPLTQAKLKTEESTQARNFASATYDTKQTEEYLHEQNIRKMSAFSSLLRGFGANSILSGAVHGISGTIGNDDDSSSGGSSAIALPEHTESGREETVWGNLKTWAQHHTIQRPQWQQQASGLAMGTAGGIAAGLGILGGALAIALS